MATTTPGIAATATTKALAAVEWKSQWPLVLACSLGFSFSTVVSQSIGLFMGPLEQDLGWTRFEISIGMTISGLSAIFLSPLAGGLIDRWGSRWLAIPSLLCVGLAMAAFGLVRTVEQWFAIWAFYALVSTGVKLTVWTTAVSKSFTAGRGLAVAMVIAGTAFAGIFAPPITNFLINHFGWRMAFVALGLGWGSVSLLLSIFFLFEPDRRPAAANAAVTPPRVLAGLTMSEALHSWALWRIGLSTLIFMVFAATMVIHQVPILIEAGVSRDNAALLASLAAVAGFAGKVVTGALMDRFHAARLSGVTLAVCSVAFALLIEPLRSPLLIVVAMLLVGYTGGAKLQVTTYLTGRYGGLKNFGKIFGFMNSVIAIGGSIGPLAASRIFDTTGSYSAFLIAGIPGCLVSGLLIWGLGAYPRWESDGDAMGAR